MSLNNTNMILKKILPNITNIEKVNEIINNELYKMNSIENFNYHESFLSNKNQISNKNKKLINCYKLKVEELLNMSDLLEIKCRKYEKTIKDCNEDIYSLEQQLNDYNSDKDNFEDIIEKLKEERNFALESAEKQHELLKKYKTDSMNQFNEVNKENERVISEKEQLQNLYDNLIIENDLLKIQLKNNTKDLFNEKKFNKYKDSKILNLIQQGTLNEQKISKLHDECQKVEEIKKENKRINLNYSELKKKSDQNEKFFEEHINQTEKLQKLVNKFRLSMERNIIINGKNNIIYNKINYKFENNTAKNDSLKNDLINLNRKNLNTIIYIFNELKIAIAIVEQERNFHIELISSLETKISEMKINESSLEEKLNQQNLQITQMQNESQDKSKNEANLYIELKKKSLKITSLEISCEENASFIEKMSKQIQELEKKIKLKEECIEQVENDVFVKQNNLTENSFKIDFLQNKLHDNMIHINCINKNYNEEIEKLEKMIQKCNTLEIYLKEANDINFSLESECKTIKESKFCLEKKFTEQLHSYFDKYNLLEKSFSRLQKRFSKLNEKYEKEIAEYENIIKNNSKIIENLNDKIKSKNDEIGNKINHISNMENKLSIQQNVIDESKLKISDLISIEKSLKERISLLENELAKNIEIAQYESSMHNLNLINLEIKQKDDKQNELLQNLTFLKLENKKLIEAIETNFNNHLIEIDQEVSKFNEIDKELKNSKEENKKLNKILNEIYNDMEICKLKNNEIKTELEEMKKIRENLNLYIDQLRYDLEQHNLKSLEYERFINKTKLKNEIILKENHDLNIQINSFNLTIDENKTQIKKLTKDIEIKNEIIKNNDFSFEKTNLENKQLIEELENKISNFKEKLFLFEEESHNKNYFLKDKEEQLKNIVLLLKEKSSHMNQMDQEKKELETVIKNKHHDITLQEKDNQNLIVNLKLAKNTIQQKDLDINKFKESIFNLENNLKEMSLELTDSNNILNKERLENKQNLKELKLCHDSVIVNFRQQIFDLNDKLSKLENSYQSLLELKNNENELTVIKQELEYNKITIKTLNENILSSDFEIKRLQELVSVLSSIDHKYLLENTISHSSSNNSSQFLNVSNLFNLQDII